MQIDRTLVEKLAMLSRMRLTDEEATRYSRQLTNIVEFVEHLNEVDITEFERVRQILGLSNVMREDSVESCQNTDELIHAFPETNDRELEVPPVL